MTRIRLSPALLALSLALSAAACSDDDPVRPDPLTMAKVAGVYIAGGDVGVLTFEDEDGEIDDVLERGAEFEIELDADGTTTGSYFMPEGNEDGGDVAGDLAGKWTLKGDTVQFTHDADTFLRDIKFVVKGKELVGSGEVSDGILKATLVKE